MIAITSYEVTELGLTLPAACIEVKEVNSAKESYYQSTGQSGDPIMKNTIVRYRVWVSESAYNGGKKHVAEGQREINFSASNQDTVNNIALNLAFPESTIQ